MHQTNEIRTLVRCNSWQIPLKDSSCGLAARRPAVAGLAAAECALRAYGSAAANGTLAPNGVLELAEPLNTKYLNNGVSNYLRSIGGGLPLFSKYAPFPHQEHQNVKNALNHSPRHAKW